VSERNPFLPAIRSRSSHDIDIFLWVAALQLKKNIRLQARRQLTAPAVRSRFRKDHTVHEYRVSRQSRSCSSPSSRSVSRSGRSSGSMTENIATCLRLFNALTAGERAFPAQQSLPLHCEPAPVYGGQPGFSTAAATRREYSGHSQQLQCMTRRSHINDDFSSRAVEHLDNLENGQYLI